jgi:putative transposase
VARELDALIVRHGKPASFVSDAGTELTSKVMLKWKQTRGVAWHYIAPGMPQQAQNYWAAEPPSHRQ